MANKIFREKKKKSNMATTSLKVRSKKELIEDHRNISHKNYLMKILKEEITNLNVRENQISTTLLISEKKLQTDELEFNKCIENDFKKFKMRELVRI